MSIPQAVIDSKRKLDEICEEHAKFVPLEIVAEYIGTDADSLRQSIDQGKCKFGIGWTSGKRNIRYNKIPTITFYTWVTGLNIAELNSAN